MSGIELLVEAFGCSESALRDVARLADLFLAREQSVSGRWRPPRLGT